MEISFSLSKIGKKVIIPQNHMNLAVLVLLAAPCFDPVLAPFRISQMDQHIKRSRLFNYSLQVTVPAMCVTYD